MGQKCTLEKQILQNALSLSNIALDEIAHRIMKAPEYTTITAGEVIHLIKCIPVEYRIRQTESCFIELPVIHGNTSAFLLSGSRILTRNDIMHCNRTPTNHGINCMEHDTVPDRICINHPVVDASNLEICKSFKIHDQRNLLRRRSGSPLQSYNVFCRKTSDAKYTSTRDNGI